MRLREITERQVDPSKLAQRTARRYGTEPDYGYSTSGVEPGKYIPLKSYDGDLVAAVDSAFNQVFKKWDFYKQPPEKRKKIRQQIDREASTYQTVPIRDLYAYQPFVRIEDPDLLKKKIQSTKQIVVVKFQNRLVVRDGHHAVLAARLRGEKQIPAEVTMRYTELKLVEGYKEVTQKFAQEAEAEQVKKAIDQYRDLVNRNQVQGDERNIDWWGKQGWERFRTFVNAKSQQQSITQQKKRKNTGRSHTLAENDRWLIVVPLDKDASCFHGKGTDWCTTKPDHDYFHVYFLNSSATLIYFLQKQTGAKWAASVHPDGEETYFDKNDNSIRKKDFSKQTGIPLDTVTKYVDMVSNKSTDVAKKANKARSNIQKQVDKMFQLLDRFTKGPSGVKDLELENYIVKYGGLEQKALSAKEIYFTHLLKKPVELDTRMQKVFRSMWTNPDEMVPPPDNQEELIKNVTII